MNGRTTYATHHHTGEGGEGLSFGSKLRVVSDGALSDDKTNITVCDATYVIVYGAFATNYNVNKFDVDESIDYRALINECIEKTASKDYEEIKKERFNRLLALQHPVCLAKNKEREGKDVRVYVESVSKNDAKVLSGKTAGGKTVDFVGPAELIGQFCTVTVTKAKSWSLDGKIKE
jgi:hypothetical protein